MSDAEVVSSDDYARRFWALRSARRTMTNPEIFPAAARLRDHPIHANLKNVQKRLTSKRPPDFRNNPIQIRSTRTRLRVLLKMLQLHLESLNPITASTPVLDALNKQLEAIKDALQQYYSNPTGHQASLESQLDALAQRILPLGSLGHVSEQFNVFTAELEDMDAAISAGKTTIEEQGKEAKETAAAFKAALAKLEEFKGDIETQRGRLDKIINDQTQVFSKGETDRAAKAAAALDEQRRQVAEQLDNFKKKHEERISASSAALQALVEKQSAEAEGSLKALGERLGKAKELVGIIASTGTAGQYQRTANRELWSAWVMRGVALLCFAGMVAMMAWFVHGVSFRAAELLDAEGVVAQQGASDTPAWYLLLMRFGLGAALLIPGFYSARESSKHWRLHGFHSQRGIELAALGAYLDQLPEAKRHDILEKTAPKYFGNDVHTEVGAAPIGADRGLMPKELVFELLRASRGAK